MRHLDLFSGIGGFSIAADRVWEDVEHVFCDNDKFCREVLSQHWEGAKIYDDIRDIITEAPAGTIDLVTGGFPCQPFSQAGKRRGTKDDRYLWGEMFDVIQLTKPRWVIAENVKGLLTMSGGLVFEQVCSDLESAGYEVQPFVIPAVALNAPHRRDRVWIIAHANSIGSWSAKPRGDGEAGGVPEIDRALQQPAWEPERAVGNVTDAPGVRDGGRGGKERGAGERLLVPPEPPRSSLWGQGQGCARDDWQESWLTVAFATCDARLDDGLPGRLGDATISTAQHRRQQIKAYGNAIVPEVAVEIMKAIQLQEEAHVGSSD